MLYKVNKVLWYENAQPARFCVIQNTVHRAWRDHQRGGGGTTQAPPAPAWALQGTADVPTCLPGAARCRGQDPQTFLGLRLCPLGQEGLGQSDSQGASGHQGLCTATWEVCALSVLMNEDGRVLGHLFPSPHPRACVPGAQRACGAVSVALEGMPGHQALVLCPRL